MIVYIGVMFDVFIFTSSTKLGRGYVFASLFICEQLPDHNFNRGVTKPAGINCYVNMWK